MCNLDYENKKYIDNIYSIFEHLDTENIISICFIIIFLGLLNLLINTIINKYSVCHLFLFVQNKEIIISSIIFRIKIKNDKTNNVQFLLELIFVIFEIFGFLLLLEFIELNCCGLSENTKKNIKKREIEDSSLLNKDILNTSETSLIEDIIEEEKKEDKNIIELS